MSQTIKIRDFSSVIQYADLEDLPDGAMTELKNMRVVYGKLVKTSEMGAFLTKNGTAVILDLSSKAVTGFATWIHSRLSASSQPVGSGTGFLYLVATINTTTKKLQIYTWNATSEAWVAIDSVATGLYFTTASYYQSLGADIYNRVNPILQIDQILRFLPGNTAKPDGTNAAVGAWIGWIGRDYFDGLYPASSYTAKFFSYPTNVEKPDFVPTIAQHGGDGAFSPADSGIPITNLSEENNTVTMAGEYPGVFFRGKLFEILGNSTNFGTYRALSSSVEGENGQTVITIDTSYKDFLGSEKLGFIKATTEKESRYYKFSYVYDGNQESLLSDAYKVDFADQTFPSFASHDTLADFSKRITAIKVYRSPNGEAGTYRLIHTIDFLRESGKYKSGENGAYSGDRNIYIPDIGTVTPSVGTSKIKLFNNNTQTFRTEYTISSYSGTRFTVSADVEDDDYWDCAWQYSANGAFSDTVEGGSGAFAGQKVCIVGEDLGAINYGGGVLESVHGSATGWRIIDATYGMAVHTTKYVDTGGGANGQAWKILSVENGLFYYYLAGGEYYWVFFDTNLPDGAAHPLEGQLSIDVNGRFARMIAGRLFQANIVLDPEGDAEEHEDWASHSEINQPDVTPVSNVLRFPEREGGKLTGLEELFGMAVFLKKQAIITVNCRSNPANPALWTVTESAHDIGNVAPEGAVKAGDSLYVCANDGIYKITPNNLSASDATPTAKLKITEPINNIYNSMTAAQKQRTKAEYHPRRNEIHYFFNYPVEEVDTDKHWAYNVITGAWRESSTSYWYANGLALDENANAMFLDTYLSAANVQYCWVRSLETHDEDGYGRCLFRSKWFTISNESPEPIYKITVVYKSPHALKLRIYLDGNDTMTAEYDLPAQAYSKPFTVGVGYSAYRMQFVITDDTGEALVAEETASGPVYLIVEQNEVSPNVEISGMDIVHS